MRTPLVPFGTDARILFKLECLHPIGSFKLRGALSAIRAASADELAQGVVTASAGNMAQGVAWAAREAGVPARVIAPADAPRAKLDRVEALGAELVPVTHEEWWQAMVDRGREGVEGLFVAPAAEEAVMAGNGTIGLEIAEDAPEFDTVVIPWGGGGLTHGDRERRQGAAARGARRHRRAGDRELRSPRRSRRASRARSSSTPSWVDGAGGRALLPGMWERARGLVDEAVAVPLAEVEEAVRLLASRAHVVAEGAGALALAAALRRDDRCVCIVSGGNIDPDVYAGILSPAATA